ncbi:hypothetical protein VP01_2582g1 [Puccinia sorghi]|uniref:Uncharacterized protein n=1 Tax=Puccinia sorghi TaxID=27349 RepID=A0A0L6V4Y3_9BASI|nr:hypothetical protein VP01_2582g1 [Puccinia sorghi]
MLQQEATGKDFWRWLQNNIYSFSFWLCRGLCFFWPIRRSSASISNQSHHCPQLVCQHSRDTSFRTNSFPKLSLVITPRSQQVGQTKTQRLKNGESSRIPSDHHIQTFACSSGGNSQLNEKKKGINPGEEGMKQTCELLAVPEFFILLSHATETIHNETYHGRYSVHITAAMICKVLSPNKGICTVKNWCPLIRTWLYLGRLIKYISASVEVSMNSLKGRALKGGVYNLAWENHCSSRTGKCDHLSYGPDRDVIVDSFSYWLTCATNLVPARSVVFAEVPSEREQRSLCHRLFPCSYITGGPLARVSHLLIQQPLQLLSTHLKKAKELKHTKSPARMFIKPAFILLALALANSGLATPVPHKDVDSYISANAHVPDDYSSGEVPVSAPPTPSAPPPAPTPTRAPASTESGPSIKPALKDKYSGPPGSVPSGSAASPADKPAPKDKYSGSLGAVSPVQSGPGAAEKPVPKDKHSIGFPASALAPVPAPARVPAPAPVRAPSSTPASAPVSVPAPKDKYSGNSGYVSPAPSGPAPVSVDKPAAKNKYSGSSGAAPPAPSGSASGPSVKPAPQDNKSGVVSPPPSGPARPPADKPAPKDKYSGSSGAASPAPSGPAPRPAEKPVTQDKYSGSSGAVSPAPSGSALSPTDKPAPKDKYTGSAGTVSPASSNPLPTPAHTPSLKDKYSGSSGAVSPAPSGPALSPTDKPASKDKYTGSAGIVSPAPSNPLPTPGDTPALKDKYSGSSGAVLPAPSGPPADKPSPKDKYSGSPGVVSSAPFGIAQPAPGVASDVPRGVLPGGPAGVFPGGPAGVLPGGPAGFFPGGAAFFPGSPAGVLPGGPSGIVSSGGSGGFLPGGPRGSIFAGPGAAVGGCGVGVFGRCSPGGVVLGPIGSAIPTGFASDLSGGIIGGPGGVFGGLGGMMGGFGGIVGGASGIIGTASGMAGGTSAMIGGGMSGIGGGFSGGMSTYQEADSDRSSYSGASSMSPFGSSGFSQSNSDLAITHFSNHVNFSIALRFRLCIFFYVVFVAKKLLAIVCLLIRCSLHRQSCFFAIVPPEESRVFQSKTHPASILCRATWPKLLQDESTAPCMPIAHCESNSHHILTRFKGRLPQKTRVAKIKHKQLKKMTRRETRGNMQK